MFESAAEKLLNEHRASNKVSILQEMILFILYVCTPLSIEEISEIKYKVFEQGDDGWFKIKIYDDAENDVSNVENNIEIPRDSEINLKLMYQRICKLSNHSKWYLTCLNTCNAVRRLRETKVFPKTI